MIKTISTGFSGLILIEPQTFKDDRGKFYESWHFKDYQQAGIRERFIQDDISISLKNVLRGLHYQKNQGQLVTVVYGKIFDVAVDIRPNSKTYKKYFSIELNADNLRQLYMPPGFAHGFWVLSSMTIINYKCTQYYNKNFEGGIRWDDPTIKIKWPAGKKIISDKDKNFCYLTS